MSAEQIRRMLDKFAAIILDEIADENIREITERLDKLAHQLAAEPDGEDPHEPR